MGETGGDEKFFRIDTTESDCRRKKEFQQNKPHDLIKKGQEEYTPLELEKI